MNSNSGKYLSQSSKTRWESYWERSLPNSRSVSHQRPWDRHYFGSESDRWCEWPAKELEPTSRPSVRLQRPQVERLKPRGQCSDVPKPGWKPTARWKRKRDWEERKWTGLELANPKCLILASVSFRSDASVHLIARKTLIVCSLFIWTERNSNESLCPKVWGPWDGRCSYLLNAGAKLFWFWRKRIVICVNQHCWTKMRNGLKCTIVANFL